MHAFFPYAQNCFVLLLRARRWWGGTGLFCISFSAANFVLRVFFRQLSFLFYFFFEVEVTSRSRHKYFVCEVVSNAVIEDFGWCSDIIRGNTEPDVVDVNTVWGQRGGEKKKNKKNTRLHPIRCSEPIPPSAQLLHPRLLRPSGLNPTQRCPWRSLPVTRRRTNCHQAWQLRVSEDWRQGWRSWRSQGSGWRWGRRGEPRWPPRCRSEPLRSQLSGRRRSGGACGRRRSSQHRCRCPAGGQTGWTPPQSRSSPGNCQRRECGSGPVWTPRGPSEKRKREGRRRKIEEWEQKSTKENWRMNVFPQQKRRDGGRRFRKGSRGERYKLRSVWIIYLHVSGNIFIDLPSTDMQPPPLHCVAVYSITCRNLFK